MREPHQIAIVTGSINYNHAVCTRQRFDRVGESLAPRRFIFGTGIVDSSETKMIRHFEIASDLLGPGAPVLDKVGKAFLSRIEIDGGDALARLDQRNCYMRCDRRF